MGKSRSIDRSRKAFGTLLNLYPVAHRSEYGSAMLQVFTEQCRAAYAQKGVFGVILLWLRTLPDVGYTSVLEHITAPGATWGLMEPIPNAPLPWKGVLLVLLPGLVYLVSQVAQLSGIPWYMTVYYRAAFLLIIPVLVAWAIMRRFPIWGLIPLGLLYRLAQEIGHQLISLQPGVFSSNPLLNAVLQAARSAQGNIWLSVVVFVPAIVLLAWRYMRQQGPSRAIWVLLGVYTLLAIAQTAYNLTWMNLSSPEPLSLSDLLQGRQIPYDLLDFGALLLLVFMGTLFLKRHGFFAILIPLGYMLPAMLMGVFDNLESINNPVLALLVVSGAVLAYRSLLSLIVPIWMARSSTQTSKARVAVIAVAIALLIHAAMQVYSSTIYLGPMGWPTYYFPWNIISIAAQELKIAGAMALAIVLYGSFRPTGQPASSPTGEAPALSAGEA